MSNKIISPLRQTDDTCARFDEEKINVFADHLINVFTSHPSEVTPEEDYAYIEFLYSCL